MLKRWMQDKNKRKVFVRRALKTRALMKDIAKRIRIKPLEVSKINRSLGIRDKGTSFEIRAEFRRKKRKKVNFFTEEQKLEIIRKNRGGIIRVAKSWWGSLQSEYNSFEDFLKDLEGYTFEQLDYYDPKIVTKYNKPLKFITWIWNGLNFFCLHAYEPKRRRKKLQIPFEVTGQIVKSKMAKTEIKLAISRIPRTARKLLKDLEISLEDTVEAGFEEVKSELLRIASQKETSLSQREFQVILYRLNNLTFEEIEITGTREWPTTPITQMQAINIYNKAIEKIKKRIQQINPNS